MGLGASEPGQPAEPIRNGEAGSVDWRDAEIQRLRRELEKSRSRERAAHARTTAIHGRFSELARANTRFAASVRRGAMEWGRARRRSAAQIALARLLEGAEDLQGAAPEVFGILGERLGWDVGLLWSGEGGELRCGAMWRRGGGPPGALWEACDRFVFGRGEGLPGRAWETGEVVWVEDVLAEKGFERREAAQAERLRGAIAIPIQDGAFCRVLEFFRREPLAPDEDLLHIGALIGSQLAQFVERRRAERERDEALARERATRRELSGILESISDAFFALDEDLRFVYVNSEAERLLRRSREELLGREAAAELPWRAGREPCAQIRRSLEEGVVASFETYSESLDAWVSARVYPTEAGVSVYLQDVTERRRAELVLRESEERFRTVAELVPDLLWHSEPGGGATWYNRRWTEYTGRAIEDALGFGWFDAVHPDDREGSLRSFRDAVETGRPLLHEHRMRRHDGAYHWFLVRAEPVRDSSGGILYWLGAATDVQESHAALEALRESEERFRTLVANIPGAVYRCAPHPPWSMRFISDRVEVITGYPASEFLAAGTRSYESVIHPEDREMVARGVSEALRRHEPYALEYRILHADGSVRWVQETGCGFSAGDGEVLWLDGAVFDMTERKRAEDAMRRSEQRYRSLVTTSSSIVWATDAAGEATRPSRAWEEFTGQRPGEYLGTGWLEAVHPEDRRRVYGVWESAQREGRTFEAEGRLRRHDGRYRRVVVRGVPIRDAAGAVCEWTGTITDVHDRRVAEEERERALRREWTARAQAEERRRISRDLHDRVAHWMAVVHQSLELYEALREANPEAARTRLEIARGTVKEALRYTRDLSLLLRRPEVSRSLEAALADLLREVVLPETDSRLSVRGDEEMLPAELRNQLFMILREAVRNAVAHSGCSSVSVVVEVSPEAVSATVEDDGCGFEGAADGARDGGLRYMRERAALLGGELEVSSEPEGGTRVEVRTPLRGGSRWAPKNA